MHILSTIIVICLSVKIGFAVVEVEDAEAAAVSFDMAADAVLITDASSIIGSGDEGGEDLSPETETEAMQCLLNGPSKSTARMVRLCLLSRVSVSV